MAQLIYVCDGDMGEVQASAIKQLESRYPAMVMIEAGSPISSDLIDLSAAETILVQAAANLSASQIDHFIKSTTVVSPSEVAVADYIAAPLCITFPDLEVSDLVTWMSSQTAWPIGAVRCGSEVIKAVLPLVEGCSSRAILAATIVHTIANHHELIRSEAQIEIDSAGQKALSLNSKDLSQLLRFTLENINIEELFPTHPWEKFTEESAAACYHTLAALFFKLEDTQTAAECIQFSEGLEDSPRALALKGLIAYQQGETLAAVANMVSSLQEYERRKKQSSEHYISFAPKNLEVVNENLQSGLSALNKRDNNLAVGHFAKAVFEFDNFFEQYGISLAERANS